MGLLDFLSLNKNAPDLAPAYTAIMAQARKPDHYGAGAVPDSFDGRFDMLAVHVHLVLRRLRSDGVARDDIGQALFDMFFRDM
ncbi:MAG: ubiquinol-cytochrome C chaperone family protein, partial [Parvibaculales bacterium]